ncbi:MAG TPA: hypothetical protein DEG69_01725 [Flavobacteriaceae bacterium]|nr:hypothetical protein [Flavobacteriaceae bacterium]
MNTFSLKKTQKLSTTSSGRINDHNIDNLSKDFIKDGFVEIPNFLEKDFADKCHTFYFNEMPETWFKVASTPNEDGDSPKTQNYSDNTSPQFNHVSSVFNNGGFSYFFHRTINDHKSDCPCFECVIRSFFSSNEMLNFLSALTKKDISTTSEHFTSWYKKNNFLSAHHDDKKGSIGVVLDFAKNWNPVFGGNLYLLEDDWFEVKKVIVPKFNNLKVFDIPEKKNGVPHFVSTVVADNLPNRKRIAFGGWYK